MGYCNAEDVEEEIYDLEKEIMQLKEKLNKAKEALERIATGELITTQRGTIFIDRDEAITLQGFALEVLRECGL